MTVEYKLYLIRNPGIQSISFVDSIFLHLTAKIIFIVAKKVCSGGEIVVMVLT